MASSSALATTKAPRPSRILVPAGRWRYPFQLQRPAPDRNPRNIEITEVSVGGVSDKILNSLLGFRSLRSYADEYATQYDIRSFAIEDNKVVIENGGKTIPGVTP